jgi:hypothetical protein
MKLSLRSPSSVRALRSRRWAVPLAAATGLTIAACGSVHAGFDDEPPPNDPGFTSDAGSVEAGDGSPCLSDTLGAVPVPLAMLLVMDRSGSMSSPSGNTKWDQARNAMIGFVDTKGASGTKIGLTVFPPDTGGGDQCQASSYVPVVPIALLPGNGSAIKDALLTRVTLGSTPMAGAMQGGVAAMTSFLATNPNEEGVIILVTDGDPGACTGDTVSNVTAIASSAATGTPRIRTFVVGMDGATFSNLDAIAKAGEGSPTAFNASGGGSDAGVSPQQQLLDALEKIRSGALGCEYLLPTPDSDKGVLDPTSVELDFTAGTNDPAVKIRRVDGAAQCGATTGGFFYDDPKSPTRIILCPSSCEDVRNGTSSAKVDVFLGCIKKVK